MKWLYPVSLVTFAGYIYQVDKLDAAGALIASAVIAWALS